MVNNDIKRIKAKLKLFDVEGFSWALGDAVDMLVDGGTNDGFKAEFVEILKSSYLRQLELLMPKEHKQSKLDI